MGKQGDKRQPGQPGDDFPAGARNATRPAGSFYRNGGLASLFRTGDMPTELQISYWIWLVSGVLGILVGILAFFAATLALAVMPAVGIVILLAVLLSLALSVAQIVLAVRLKDGNSRARKALTVIVGVTLLISLVLAALGLDGNWLSFIITVGAAVLMWLPKSQQWFAERAPGNA